jgi:hypothetical protein
LQIRLRERPCYPAPTSAARGRRPGDLGSDELLLQLQLIADRGSRDWADFRINGQSVAEAIAGLRRRPPAPFKPALPMTVAVRMHGAEAAERAAGRPTVQRVDELTVQGRVDRQCDVVKWLLGTGLDMPPERP